MQWVVGIKFLAVIGFYCTGRKSDPIKERELIMQYHPLKIVFKHPKHPRSNIVPTFDGLL